MLSTAFARLARAAPITIDTVPVNDVGNAPDAADGDSGTPGIQSFGNVSYAYRLGKLEVTNAAYANFLNAVDPTGANDLALYNANMNSDARGGILLNLAAPNGAKYLLKSGQESNPVVYVSWYDAIRFTNWLNNGQGSGSTETGAYTLLGGTPTPSNATSIVREPGAIWFLPSENEWYKGAYYDQALNGGAGNYYAYPTASNSVPFSDQPPGSGAPNPANTANFFKSDGVANGYDDGYAVTGTTILSGSQNNLSNVGAYPMALGPYGTFDQGGNAWEWNEALIAGNRRGLRGGSWLEDSTRLTSSFRLDLSPAFEGSNVGFRVATVPEPSTFALAALGTMVFCLGARYRVNRCKQSLSFSPEAGSRIVLF